jgi:hypothetical protein
VFHPFDARRKSMRRRPRCDKRSSRKKPPVFMRVPELVTAGATSVKHPERVEHYLAHMAREFTARGDLGRRRGDTVENQLDKPHPTEVVWRKTTLCNPFGYGREPKIRGNSGRGIQGIQDRRKVTLMQPYLIVLLRRACL